LVNAVSASLNGEEIQVYLQRAYLCMLRGMNPFEEKIKIFLCTGHILKAFSRHLSRKVLNKNTRRIALHALGSIIEATNCKEYHDRITRFISLFDLPNLPSDIANEYARQLEGKHYEKQTEMMESFEKCMRSDKQFEEFLPPENPKLKRDQSPFYTKFVQRRQEIHTKHACNADDVNPFYKPEVVNILQNTYMPYAGLWTLAVPNNKRTQHFGISTTNCVESYFSKHNTIYHTDVKNDTPAYVMDHADVVYGDTLIALKKGMKVKHIKEPRKKKTRILKRNKHLGELLKHGARNARQKHPFMSGKEFPHLVRLQLQPRL